MAEEEAATDNANGVSFAEDETEEEESTTPTITHEDLFAAVEDSHISPRPLVNFFNSNKREAICNIVNSTKFNKSRARRLFSALSPILIKIIDDESYLPDEDEEDGLFTLTLYRSYNFEREFLIRRSLSVFIIVVVAV